MVGILIGIVVLVVILVALKVFMKADPRGLAYGARVAGGLAALAAAVFLVFRGQLSFALPLGITGLGLLGWLPWKAINLGQRMRKSRGQVSRVRSPFLDMELDHDSGAMRGQVIAGRHQGAALEALDIKTVVEMLSEVDEESRALLQAYLDRRDAGWREHADAGTAAGEVHAPRSGKMTDQEAYEILGLQPGASAGEIGRAHRALMKKLHPDQGGSTYLAARVNEAKDVLLRRHR